MIHAKELRIGNVFIGIAGIQTVMAIEDNTNRMTVNCDFPESYDAYSHIILCKENRNQYKPCEIEAIPLTEELLLNFGFTSQGNEGHISKGKNGEVPSLWYLNGCSNDFIMFENNEFYLASVFKPYENSDIPSYKSDYIKESNNIQYIHQLQNLVFSLNGKELSFHA